MWVGELQIRIRAPAHCENTHKEVIVCNLQLIIGTISTRINQPENHFLVDLIRRRLKQPRGECPFKITCQLFSDI